MKQITTAFIFFLFLLPGSYSQEVSNKLKLDQGQTFDITLQVKTSVAQQAGGQSIEFSVDATGDHSYKVTNATEDNSTLHHQVKQILFSMDGMGRKITFDSNNEKDLNGQFGKPIKDILDKTYDIIIDPTGKVLMALPEKIQLGETDSRMAIVSTLLKDVLDLVQPPQKGGHSFFKVLPDSGAVKGSTWTESYKNEQGKFDAAYALSDITDSTIIIDFAANAVTVNKAEMMGSETTTTLNSKSTGKIILDRVTGIMREKTINTESTGTTESSFGNLPVTSKTTTTIKVRPVN